MAEHINSFNEHGFTPFMVAASLFQSPSIIEILTSHQQCFINTANPLTGNTTLHYLVYNFVRSNPYADGRALMESSEKTELYSICSIQSQIRTIKQILQIPSINYNLFNFDGYTPFMLLICRENIHMLRAVLIHAKIHGGGGRGEEALRQLLQKPVEWYGKRDPDLFERLCNNDDIDDDDDDNNDNDGTDDNNDLPTTVFKSIVRSRLNRIDRLTENGEDMNDTSRQEDSFAKVLDRITIQKDVACLRLMRKMIRDDSDYETLIVLACRHNSPLWLRIYLESLNYPKPL